MKMSSTRTRIRKNADLFEQALARVVGMLDTVEVMFARAVDSLADNSKLAGARQTVFEMDKSVDAAQRQIRRDLVVHLTAEPTHDAVGCLMLMVIAKDAERAGDYCKNLAELTELTQGPFGATKYGATLRETFADVKKLFAPTRTALGESDLGLVRRVVTQTSDISTRCSSVIQIIARDGELTENQAVCLALAFRGCRRISAHLANIASTAAGPPFGIADVGNAPSDSDDLVRGAECR